MLAEGHTCAAMGPRMIRKLAECPMHSTQLKVFSCPHVALETSHNHRKRASVLFDMRSKSPRDYDQANFLRKCPSLTAHIDATGHLADPPARKAAPRLRLIRAYCDSP